MLRASSVHRICTNRPSFDEEAYRLSIEELEEKTIKKLKHFDITMLSTLQETAGLKTIANTVAKHLESKKLVEEDPLPPGAKSYLQELWLENQGFYSFSLLEQSYALQKGNLNEQMSLDILNAYCDTHWKKNTERVEKGFLSGEADVVLDKAIIDLKNPETWESFRKKEKIETAYHWQLVAYCYLYDKEVASLKYILTPCPEDLVDKVVQNYSANEINRFIKLQETIKNIAPGKNIKSFDIPKNIIEQDIPFLVSRIGKAEEYYNSLDYDQCMKMNVY